MEATNLEVIKPRGTAPKPVSLSQEGPTTVPRNAPTWWPMTVPATSVALKSRTISFPSFRLAFRLPAIPVRHAPPVPSFGARNAHRLVDVLPRV